MLSRKNFVETSLEPDRDGEYSAVRITDDGTLAFDHDELVVGDGVHVREGVPEPAHGRRWYVGVSAGDGDAAGRYSVAVPAWADRRPRSGC